MKYLNFNFSHLRELDPYNLQVVNGKSKFCMNEVSVTNFT